MSKRYKENKLWILQVEQKLCFQTDVRAGSEERAKVDAGGLAKRKGAALKSERLEIVFATVEVKCFVGLWD